jgi:hypothetical protein
VAALPKQTAQQYTAFIVAMDKLSALGELGFRLGLVRLSPDVLRGLARTLEPALAVDPVAYNLDVDSTLRTLLGFGLSLPVPKPSPAVEHSWLRKPMFRFDHRHLFRTIELVRTASAAEPDVAKLNQWVPEPEEVGVYLESVRDLLKDVGAEVLGEGEIANEFRILFIHTVLAAAWQESCWRQFVKKGDKLVPLSSPSGDVGLMQVNRHIWRGVYDIKGLSTDIEYNGRAGSEILSYYLTRYAIKNNEHKKPGGHLARAIYAAYNGGPGNLARYRAKNRLLAIKKIDDLFWEKYQAVSSGNELAVERCYSS